MKKLNKNSVIAAVAVSLIFGLAGPIAAFAATDPGLNTAASFSVLAQTHITGISTISGDVGMNSVGANITNLTAGNVGGHIYSADGLTPSTAILAPSVQSDASTAYTATIPGEPATASIGPALDGLVLVPGVYDIGAGRLNGGVLTLNGSGLYIFRASSDFVTSGSIVLENGARACDVYWNVASLATVNGSSFVGTILAGTGVHFGANVSLNGRALAVGGDVTMINDTISGPTCAAAPVAPAAPAAPAVASGGAVGVSGRIVPLIGIVKVPTPLALPAGPGPVTYNYTVWNVGGQQAIDDVSVTDNACSPVTYVSGDTNGNGKIDPHEMWKYTCTTTLSATTANIATATGYSDDAYHQPTVATAVATVVVGAPVTPPIINIVKVPSRLTPFPAGGGNVTYTYAVTNPGTIPMSNVSVADNKCAPVSYVSGDANGNNLLEPGETWTYTCETNVPVSTSDIATAKGTANGFTAVDYAYATVLVASPSLPNTGYPPRDDSASMMLAAAVLALVSASLAMVLRKRKV